MAFKMCIGLMVVMALLVIVGPTRQVEGKSVKETYEGVKNSVWSFLKNSWESIKKVVDDPPIPKVAIVPNERDANGKYRSNFLPTFYKPG